MNRAAAVPKLGLFDPKDPVALARALSLYESNVTTYLRDRAVSAFGPFERTAKQTATVSARPWQYVRVDPTAGTVPVVLPRVTDPNVKGSVVIVKNVSGSTNAITVSALGTTIDGAASVTMNTARAVQWFYAGDDEWERIV